MEGYCDLRYENLLAPTTKNLRDALQVVAPEAAIAACRRFLSEHPNGGKCAYQDMGIAFPDGIRPGSFFGAIHQQLRDAGIEVEIGKRLPNGRSGAIIRPVDEEAI